MVLCKQHVREVAYSNSIKEALASGGQELNSVKTCAQPLDASIELGLKKRLAEVLINVEQDYLPVSSAYTDLVMCDSLNALDSLGTHRLTEDKHFVFDLVRAEVSRVTSYKHKFFVGLREGDALVISDHGSGLHHFVGTLALKRVKGPKSQFFRTGNCELVVGCISELDVFHETAEVHSGDAVWEDLASHLQGRDNMPVLRVPDEKFSVKRVAGGNEEFVIVREG